MITAPLPFPRSYWIQPGKLLGGFYPGDRDESVAAAKLSALLDCGVTDIVCLMEERERDHAGQRFLDYRPALMELAKTRGIHVSWTRHPIIDLGVPSPGEMVRILDTLDAAMRHGCVYLHCWGGRGRTGTVAGCWLARHGADCLATRGGGLQPPPGSPGEHSMERSALKVEAGEDEADVGNFSLASLAALTAHRREWFPRVPETAEQREFVRNWRSGQ